MTYSLARAVLRERYLEFVRVLGHGKAREGLTGSAPLYLDPKNGGSFLACGPKYGKRSQSFAVQAGDEESFVATCLFPHLAHLNLGDGHFRCGVSK
jgi:hypothetical protein